MALSRTVLTALPNGAPSVLAKATFPVRSFQAAHVFGTVDVKGNGTTGDWHQAVTFDIKFLAMKDGAGAVLKEIVELSPEVNMANRGDLAVAFDLDESGGNLALVVTPTSSEADADIRVTYWLLNEHFQPAVA